MGQTREALTPTLAERWYWRAAVRDHARGARRLDQKQVRDGVQRLDEGALVDECFHFREELGVLALMAQVRGTATEREMVPYGQYVSLYGVTTSFGIESMHALLALLFSDEAPMRLVGFNAHQVRHGVCQRGAATRQGPRRAGPIYPETLAHNIAKLNLRDLKALVQAGVFGKKVTGILDATDLETTHRYADCGQVTRKRKRTDEHGQTHEGEVTVYGWKLMVLLEARTKIPLAAAVVKIHEPEVLWMRALVMQAQANLAGAARLDKPVFGKGVLDGTDQCWLDQRGIRFVVPAKDNMAVTVDARAQAAVGEGNALGRRTYTVRHGQGKTAWTERLETEVVGITGLTTYDQYGTAEHGRHHNRRDFAPNPIHAVVMLNGMGATMGRGAKPSS